MLLSNQFCGSGSKLVQYSATLSIRIRIRIPNTDTDPQIGANFRILNSNITGKLCFNKNFFSPVSYKKSFITAIMSSEKAPGLKYSNKVAKLYRGSW